MRIRQIMRIESLHTVQQGCGIVSEYSYNTQINMNMRDDLHRFIAEAVLTMYGCIHGITKLYRKITKNQTRKTPLSLVAERRIRSV